VRRGQIYHYRRVVPADVRAVFGVSEVTKSLDTANEIEAKRLEKVLDVQFEEKLQAARDSRDPDKIAVNVAKATQLEIVLAGDSYRGVPEHLSDDEWLDVAGRAQQHLVPRLTFVAEISQALAPLTCNQIDELRPALLSVIRQWVGRATGTPVVIADSTHTLDWAYERWLRKRAGRRANESVDRARSHLDAFKRHSKLVLLADVRRSHVLAWRDSLIDAGKLSTNSINQRIQLVGAIFRVGWADAEMPEQNLRDLTLPTDDEQSRVAWTRDEILTALRALSLGSWSAWLFLIGLTTGVRIGEPTAARVGWWNPRTSMIEVDDPRFTKAHKKHVIPVIDCLRALLERLIEGRDRDQYLFADAPRPANQRIPISHETSKWFGRFFDRQKIDRVFHELRHT